MKCKVCNRELIKGTHKCPYCGAVVSSGEKTSGSEFKWNVQDFPKPKKNTHVSIDWKSGRILNKDAGLIYDQSLNGWTEPEDVSELFSFDSQNERLQQKLDKEMDRISEFPPASARTQPGGLSSHVPPAMNFHILDDSPEKNSQLHSKKSFTFSDSGEELSSPQEKAPADRQAGRTTPKQSVHFDDEFDGGGAIPASEPLMRFHRLSDTLKAAGEEQAGGERYVSSNDDTFEDKADAAGRSRPQSAAENTPPEAQPGAEGGEYPGRETAGKSDKQDGSEKLQFAVGEGRKTSEENVFLGFSRLIEAEKKFKDDMEKISYLSPAEYEEAERAETQSQKLRFVPTISFRTIEDEYESYRRDHEKFDASAGKGKDGGGSKDEKDKEIQIKINEPSGTKVTVKTQEISLASLSDDRRIKTREVSLDSVKKPPKNVQVSVEVNAAKGNASVEVTRRHDGATVVKTLNESEETGHVYVDGEDLTEETAQEKNSPSPSPQSQNIVSPETEHKAGQNEVGQNDGSRSAKTESETEENAGGGSIVERGDSDKDINITGAGSDSDVRGGTEDSVGAGHSGHDGHISGVTEDSAGSGEDSAPDLSRSDAIASGSASSEAAQQTIQIPAAEAAEMAAALAAEKAAQSQDLDNSPGNTPSGQTGRNGESAYSTDSPESGDFWKKSYDSSKMTITDIFGPEARKIIAEGKSQSSGISPGEDHPEAQPEKSAEGKDAPDAGKTVHNSVDNAGSAGSVGGTRSGSAGFPAGSGENPAGVRKNTGRRSLILDISPEDIAPSESQTAAIHMPSGNADSSQERGVTTDTISRERQAEMQEAFEAIDSINESERRRKLKEEKKAERERLKAERAAARAEKAEKKAQKRENTPNSSSEGDRGGGFGPVAKGLIIALTVILVIEFAVIGIKLLAPDSGVAVLIERFETQITGIFSADDSPAVLGESERL